MPFASSFEWMTRLDPSTQVVGLTLGLSALVVILCVLGHHWQRVRRLEHLSRMVNKMLDRGMSGGEIAEILQAGNFGDENELKSGKGCKDKGRAQKSPA